MLDGTARQSSRACHLRCLAKNPNADSTTSPQDHELVAGDCHRADALRNLTEKEICAVTVASDEFVVLEAAMLWNQRWGFWQGSADGTPYLTDEQYLQATSMGKFPHERQNKFLLVECKIKLILIDRRLRVYPLA